MAGRAFVATKEIFHLINGNIMTLWEWLNDKKKTVRLLQGQQYQ